MKSSRSKRPRPPYVQLPLESFVVLPFSKYGDSPWIISREEMDRILDRWLKPAPSESPEPVSREQADEERAEGNP